MIFCNHEHLWLRKPDLKSTKCDQKDLNWLCLIQGWWYCYPGFPGWKELQVNVIFWSQALQLRLAFLECLSTTLIKLFQQTPEKTHLPHSDLPTTKRLSKNCHSSQPTKPQEGSCNCLKTKQHHPRKSLNSNKSKSLDTSRCLRTSLLVSVAHEKILLWWTTIWSQQTVSRKLKIQKKWKGERKACILNTDRRLEPISFQSCIFLCL